MTKKIQDQRQRGENKKPNYDIEHMNLKHITKNKNSSNLHDEYVNLREKDITWMDEKKLERLMSELLAFADDKEDEEAIKLDVFWKRKGIPQDRVWVWQQKWPHFKRFCQFVKEYLGNRREIGGIYKRMSETIILRTMSMYDPEWKEESDRLAKQRIELQNAEPVTTKTVTVLIPKFASTEEMAKIEEEETK